jgi:hypothetical protein
MSCPKLHVSPATFVASAAHRGFGAQGSLRSCTALLAADAIDGIKRDPRNATQDHLGNEPTT